MKKYYLLIVQEYNTSRRYNYEEETNLIADNPYRVYNDKELALKDARALNSVKGLICDVVKNTKEELVNNYGLSEELFDEKYLNGKGI